MKYMNLISSLFLLMTMLMSTASHALIYREADNEGSNAFTKDLENMTTIQFDPGSNIVIGAADNFIQLDADFFRFTLLEGESLTAINLLSANILNEFSFSMPTSFFGIGDLSNGTPRNTNRFSGLDLGDSGMNVPADENTSLITASLFPGDVAGSDFNLLSRQNRSDVDELGEQITFLQDFTGDITLGPGSYWVWLSELDGNFDYTLEFVIDSDNVVATPIPASVFLLVGPLGLLLRFKRKTA